MRCMRIFTSVRGMMRGWWTFFCLFFSWGSLCGSLWFDMTCYESDSSASIFCGARLWSLEIFVVTFLLLPVVFFHFIIFYFTAWFTHLFIHFSHVDYPFLVSFCVVVG